MDIKTAFLYGKIDEKVYIEQPTGFTKDNQICHLKKTLYSLKQLLQIWYTKIATFLTEQGYKATDANHAVFTKNKDSIAFYVNNLLLIGSNVNWINNFMIKTQPHLAFSIPKLSQYLNNPQDIHWNAIKQVLQYLRRSLNNGITY